MSGILEQLVARVEALEAKVGGNVAATAQTTGTVQPDTQPVAEQSVTPEQIMALVNPLVQIPAAQSELRGVVTSMGYNDLAAVPTNLHPQLYTAFKAIYERHIGGGQKMADPNVGMTLGTAQPAATTGTII